MPSGRRTALLHPSEPVRKYGPYLALAEQVPYLRSLNAALMKTEPGKKLLTKYLAVSDQDIENFKKMLDMGVEIGCYTVPTEKSVNITKYL